METTKRQEDTDALSSPTNPAHWFAYAASTYLVVLSLPLLLFPRLLLVLSTPRGAVGQSATAAEGASESAMSALGPDLTSLERYSSYTNAIGMLAIATLVLVLTGAVPVSSSPLPDLKCNGASPFRMPTIVVTTLFFAANAFAAWSQAGQSPSSAAGAAAAAAKQVSPLQLGIGTYGKVIGASHALFAFWGFCVFMFGNDLTRNAKKGGDNSARDKSVSSWPFKNQYAAEEKQKKSS
ncbi:hypothetical protein ACQY0O_002232 [Thecaphora frezii]